MNNNVNVIAEFNPANKTYKYIDSADNKFYFRIEDGEVSLVMTKTESSVVYVPASFTTEDGTEYNVNTISFGSFCRKQTLKHVIFQDGIKKIDDGIFSNSLSLLSVYIPSSVETMNSVFWKCPNFEYNDGGTIYYSGTKERWKKLLDSNSTRRFMDYTNYNDVVRFINGSDFCIPEIDFQTICKDDYDEDTETEISCIRVCEMGGEVTIPSSYIDDNGTEKIITHIGNSSFSLNNKVKKVIIPPTIEKICNGAFYKCENLEEVVIITANNMLDIDTSAFFGCKNLKKIYVGRQCQWAEHALGETNAEIIEL